MTQIKPVAEYQNALAFLATLKGLLLIDEPVPEATIYQALLMGSSDPDSADLIFRRLIRGEFIARKLTDVSITKKGRELVEDFENSTEIGKRRKLKLVKG